METIYSDRNVFWLERGSGLAMEAVGGGNAGPADPGQTFKETLHFEENHYRAAARLQNPAGDHLVLGLCRGRRRSQIVPHRSSRGASSGQATLTVTLQGATDTAADNDHHAVVSLNGSRDRRDGLGRDRGACVRRSQFDASLLHEGANTITVSGALDMGAPYSIFYVESFDLSYQQLLPGGQQQPDLPRRRQRRGHRQRLHRAAGRRPGRQQPGPAQAAARRRARCQRPRHLRPPFGGQHLPGQRPERRRCGRCRSSATGRRS